MSVGAYDQNYKRWTESKNQGSNWSAKIRIWAPGDDTSLAKARTELGLRRASGTSISAPLVASFATVIMGYEELNRNGADTQAVYDRIMSNAWPTTLGNMPKGGVQWIMNTGLRSTKKTNPSDPYYIDPKQPLGGN
jgi:hypothetical protein